MGSVLPVVDGVGALNLVDVQCGLDALDLVFVDSGVYLRYAREFLDPEQIDEVDLTKIPGYEFSVAAVLSD